MRYSAVALALVGLSAFPAWRAADAAERIIRYMPGPDAPVAYDAEAGGYREGASFDPYVCAEVGCYDVLHNVFEPLVTIAPDQTVLPHLAISWERRDDRTFRFELRRDVRFHNGERFAADAARYSLLRASQTFGATAWLPRIERVRVIGPFTIDVTLRRIDNTFLHRIALMGLMIPPRYVRRVGEEAFGQHPIGTGAFRFTGWDAERREVVLDANRDYWRPQVPRVDRIIFRFADFDEAMRALFAGEADVVRRMNPRKTTELARSGAGRVTKTWLSHIGLIQLNLLKPDSPLRDLRVRKALNLALNRPDMIRYGLIGNGRILPGYTQPEDPNHADLEPHDYDVDAARALLTEAGHGNGLALTAFVPVSVQPQLENILTRSLERIGVNLKVTHGDMSEMLDTLFLGRFRGSEPPAFDILIYDTQGAVNHAIAVPMVFLYSKQPNLSAIRDADLDRLYEDALATHDPEQARARWQALERYVYDNHLLLAAYQEMAVFGVQPDLRITPRAPMTFWDAYYEE